MPRPGHCLFEEKGGRTAHPPHPARLVFLWKGRKTGQVLTLVRAFLNSLGRMFLLYLWRTGVGKVPVVFKTIRVDGFTLKTPQRSLSVDFIGHTSISGGKPGCASSSDLRRGVGGKTAPFPFLIKEILFLLKPRYRPK